jgi:hypothetical protein
MTNHPKPDLSFERDGRSLAAWLIGLVSDDRPTREAAAQALGGMRTGWPKWSTRLKGLYVTDLPEWSKLEVQPQRFAEEVRRTVNSADFPKADFVHRLCQARVADEREWLRLVRRNQTERDGNRAPRFVGYQVFAALDSALLEDPEGLLAMRRDRQLFAEAAQAIERIGPAAVSFAGFFLDLLDQQPGPAWDYYPLTLGSIARGNQTIVDALLLRLETGNDRVRWGAAATLERMGPDLAGREDKAIQLLLDVSSRPPVSAAVISALASVGRDRPEALERVLQLAAPRPPRWVCEPITGHRYDEVMHERSGAIEALGYFHKFRDRLVPVLQDAMNTFEEFDPDYEQMRLTRVEQALQKLEEPPDDA